jgi:putative lipoic acid-binding regulatory protein
VLEGGVWTKVVSGLGQLLRVSRDSSPLEFPCELPIKVLGKNEAAFGDAALAIVRAHYGEEHRVAEQLSREGAYLSLTITVRAESREQIDAVYNDLRRAPRKSMIVL